MLYGGHNTVGAQLKLHKPRQVAMQGRTNTINILLGEELLGKIIQLMQTYKQNDRFGLFSLYISQNTLRCLVTSGSR